MTKQRIGVAVLSRTAKLLLLSLVVSPVCFGGTVLFRKAPGDFGIDGDIGHVYRREFETRMFVHLTWRQRLYCSRPDVDVNETLESYSKPDGSRWLSYRRAAPSLSEIIEASAQLGKSFDLKQHLANVHITAREVAMPVEVSDELALLWRKMLPGVAQEPRSDIRVYAINAPVFIGFRRENDMVTIGRIAAAAYDTAAYKEFAGIVDDLIKVCDPAAKNKDVIFTRLSANMRRLISRLEH